MKQQYYFKSDKQNYIVRKNKDLIKYIRNTSKKGIEFEINLNISNSIPFLLVFLIYLMRSLFFLTI